MKYLSFLTMSHSKDYTDVTISYPWVFQVNLQNVLKTTIMDKHHSVALALLFSFKLNSGPLRALHFSNKSGILLPGF